MSTIADTYCIQLLDILVGGTIRLFIYWINSQRLYVTAVNLMTLYLNYMRDHQTAPSSPSVTVVYGKLWTMATCYSQQWCLLPSAVQQMYQVFVEGCGMHYWDYDLAV